jgi:hypothetical protein
VWQVLSPAWSSYSQYTASVKLIPMRMPPAVEEVLRRAESLKQEGNQLHINEEYVAGIIKAPYIST